MVQTGFWLGDRDWWVMASIGIEDRDDLNSVYESLLSVGVPYYKAKEVCSTLSNPNTGYTYTDYDGRFTLMFISWTTSSDEMYDSIDHEKKHAVEHISSFFGVNPKSEESAYLAGEIGRLLFPAVAMSVCPKCNHL